MNGSPPCAGAQRLLVVEDDTALRELLETELEDRGYVVESASGKEAALQALATATPDLVLTDLRLPDGTGLDVLDAAARHRARPAVILITAFGSVPQAVEALKCGAHDFLTKPLDLEHLAVRLARALEQRRTGAMLESLRETLRASGRDELYHGMVGRGEVMQRLFAAIERVAQVEDPVLIIGESGTGKELVARAIHAAGPRAGKAFVAVNCASVPETLLEAEFFGHSANAFTGAGTARLGLFAEADGGTLFLDEIGEMPQTLQAKLLRALEGGRIRPLGAAEERAVDVRVITATNRDIETDAQEGRWRQDLYYRLETLTLAVPALRERGDDDRLALATHLLAGLAADRGLTGLRLSAEAYEALRGYPFPGNVRELGNALARAATFCENGLIELRHLPPRLRPALASVGATPDPLRLGDDPPPTLAALEQRYLHWILQRTGQNKKRAAEILGVGRRTIYRKLEEDSG